MAKGLPISDSRPWEMQHEEAKAPIIPAPNIAQSTTISWRENAQKTPEEFLDNAVGANTVTPLKLTNSKKPQNDKPRSEKKTQTEDTDDNRGKKQETNNN
ncbi:hypothetical protein [Enterococcus faecalis]|uniref:hypothetical protein n=1 Tax=Enterococcus faecalis TaxID=1351 RepID=UPI001177EE0C|nr:hypothetical protein [Enterococcus faecalis]